MKNKFENYNKEVMKRFMKPKFMGEINDADAVGEVGNMKCGDIMKVYLKVKNNVIKDIKFQTFGCFPPKEKVVINKSWRDISLIKKNESVINGKGEVTKIKKVYKFNYKGDIFEIVPFVSPFNSFFVTPEHPILCLKRKWFKTRSQKPNSKWLRILDSNFLNKNPKFIDAKDLEKGDYLVYTFNKKIKDSNFFTKEWMRLIGYYLSEGYITANESVVNFSFHKNELKPINEVKGLIFGILGKRCSQRTRNKVTEVYVCSRKLAKLLNSFAGKYARGKELTEEILQLPIHKQIELIDTFYIGDGDKTVRRKDNTPTYRLATASENLAIQFQIILARMGIFSSILKRPRLKNHFIGGRKIKGNEIFIVSYKKERKHKFIHKNDDYFFVPIKDIKKKKYKGFVYNLHVKNKPNSYLIRGFVVHNCVAAIASSDALCEVAKGKTIEEAKKIKDRDIVEKLGNLPSIKFHCSVLGASALKAAIANFEGKEYKEELHEHKCAG